MLFSQIRSSVDVRSRLNGTKTHGDLLIALLWSLGFVTLLGCSSTDSSPGNAETALDVAADEPEPSLAVPDLDGNKVPRLLTEPSPKASVRPSLQRSSGPNVDHIATQRGDRSLAADRRYRCLGAMKKVLTNYRLLFNKLDEGTKKKIQTGLRKNKGSSGSVTKIIRFRARDCQNQISRKSVAANLRSVFTQSDGRIGVILPLSGPGQKVGQFLLSGLKKALKDHGRQPERDLVVVDTGSYGDPLATEKALAELVFNHQISAVIGGMAVKSATVLDQWSHDLGLPTLLLTSSLDGQLTSKQSFGIYPSQHRLAKVLANAALNKKIRRVAILRSNDGKSRSLIDQFKKTFLDAGGHITHEVDYNSSDYDNLQKAVSTIFQIDIEVRAEEYAAQVEEERRTAEEDGQYFDIHKVILKPKVTFDAILLPDNFRTVRHFIKLFRYHGIEKIPLIGGHEWRSAALIAPLDPALEGSFFGDFIGTYDALPESLAVQTFQSRYFVKPSDVLATDFKMIGYRVGRLASLILKASMPTKKHLVKAIQKTKSNDQNFFGKGRIFDQDRQSLWPTYLFSIGADGISMEHPSHLK